jgi:hypothetical protein
VVKNQLEIISQVTEEENETLTSPFMEEEVKKAIFQMEHNKAPGPDGSWPNSIRAFRMSLKGTYYSSFMNSIRDTFLCLALTLVLSHYFLNKKRPNKSNSLDLYAYLT